MRQKLFSTSFGIVTMRKIVLLLLMIPLMAFGQKSMFEVFKGKPYGAIHYALRDTLRTIYYPRDEARLARALKEMKKMPDTFNNHQWELEAEFLKATFDYNLEHISVEELQDIIYKMLKKCDEYDNKVFKLRVARRLYDSFDHITTEQGAEMALRMERLCNEITPEEFPDIADYKAHLGRDYLDCGDYKHAEKLLMEVVNSPFEDNNQRIFVHARNDLGIIARIYHHDLDASDKWLKSVLTYIKEKELGKDYKLGKDIKYSEWEAIVNGSLGKNQKLRKNYQAAIPLIESSCRYMYDSIHDYAFCANNNAMLAECYIAISQPEQALKALNVSAACFDSVQQKDYDRSVLLMAKGRYYSLIGDLQQATLYLDSAEAVRKDYLDNHSLVNVYRAEVALNDEAMEEMYKKNSTVFSSLVISLIALGLSLIAIVLLVLYQIRRRKEYHALAVKAQEWAAQSVQITTPSPSTAEVLEKKVTEETGEKTDELIEKLSKLLEEEKLYRSSEVTLATLARELGTNRTALSQAINQTGINFSTMLNAYRINEAINIISTQSDCPIGDVAMQVGFNNRRSFNTAFKIVTGLTPSQFKSNK